MTDKLRAAAQQALVKLEKLRVTIDGEWGSCRDLDEIEIAGDQWKEVIALRAALAEPDDGGASEDVNETNATLASHYFRRLAMDDAIAAGNSVLLNEQALLLRECRAALDDLLRDKPMLAAKHCGTTTLGNLRAMLYEYRPQGVFGDKP